MSQIGLVSPPVNQHVLCSLCRSFWARVTCLSFTSEELSRTDKQVPSMPEHLLHSPRRSEITRSASSGCHFCSIILGSVTGCTGDHDTSSRSDDEPVYISIASLNPKDGTFLLTLFACEQREIISHDQIMNSFPLRLCPTTIKTIPILASNKVWSSVLQTSTYSIEAASLIKSWILECQSNHPFCGNDLLSLMQGLSRPPMRPKRLLDLEAFRTPDRIQLVESKSNLNLEYCTLSYSWGFSKPYVMTSSNLGDFQKEIQVRDLPQLLKDAIQVARGIGFRYLWIDALCIMQDGHLSTIASGDWLDQAGKMNDIFGNSAMTIAASEAFDGTHSLIKPRNPLSQTTCRLDPDTNLSYEVVPSCTPRCELHPFDYARYHLDTRAWVFQERILSPRTVHITRNFIHLECRTELKCEAMSGANDCHHSGAVAKADYHTLFSMFGPDGLEEFAVQLFFSYWHELIRKYSTTNLSRPSDLLVALAGLAKEVQMRSRFTWSFGLWREHLLRDMLWFVRGGSGVPRRERAPTWSWASIDVQGPQITYEASTDVSIDANIVALPETSDFARQPPLLAAESRYSVKVAGRLKYGGNSPLSRFSRLGHGIRIHRNCQGLSKSHPECPFHPDYRLPDNIDLWILLIGRASGTQRRIGTPQNWITEVGLILTPIVGHLRRYTRVGYFHHDMQRDMDSEVDLGLPSLFENSEIQQVVIV